jgi:hypothetical protein
MDFSVPGFAGDAASSDDKPLIFGDEHFMRAALRLAEAASDPERSPSGPSPSRTA